MAENIGLKYKIVGRYMEGTSVVAYHICGTNGTEMKASKDLVTYYIGRGMVVNAKCQPSADGSLIIRGVGVNLNDLPVKNERTGELKTSHGGRSISNISRERKKNVTKYELIARILKGNTVLGYVVRDPHGNERKLSRETVIGMAETGRIGNAYVTTDGGEKLLRGNGCKIDELPRLKVGLNNSVELIDDKKEETRDVKREQIIPKRNFNKSIEVYWAEVKAVAKSLESATMRDMNSNAQGGYRYPIMEVLESNTAKMSVDVSGMRYEICDVVAGISGIDKSYGIRMVLSAAGDGIEVKCNDISYLAFHLHNLGMIAFTALSKLSVNATLRELYFVDNARDLRWREYFGKKNIDEHMHSTDSGETDKNDSIIVSKADIATMNKVYDIDISPMSRLGKMKRYPSINMVSNANAKMSIRTMNGSYECISMSLSGNAELRLVVTLQDVVKSSTKQVAYDRISKEQASMKNIMMICAAAFKGNEQVQTVMVENGVEDSVLAYDFSVKLH